jgi:ubiquinone/menaquinone biosynthesis C-methylase UbiE
MAEPRDYVLPSTDAESARLERQASLYGGVDVLAPFLAERPAEVLDVGCGAGHFGRLVAGRLPDARVTGLELDSGRLAQARAASPLALVRGDMHALPFEAGCFDLVYVRFALVHDRDPLRSLAEMTRVARPGGRVVALDMIHDGIWFSPDRPAFSRLLRKVLEIMRDRGLEPNQGLHLARAMDRAGLQQVQMQVIPHLTRAPDAQFEACRDNWLETLASLSRQLAGQLDPGEVQAARDQIARDHGGDTLLEITVLASGRRAA